MAKSTVRIKVYWLAAFQIYEHSTVHCRIEKQYLKNTSFPEKSAIKNFQLFITRKNYFCTPYKKS